MARRVSLPVSDDKRLSLAHARRKLGGAVSSPGDVGQLVQVARGDTRSAGVVVWSDDERCDVWLEPDRILRCTKRDTLPAIASATSPLLGVSSAVKGFATLREGETIHVDGQDVKVLERCRWGAIVARPSGAILAIGFQRLTQKPS